MIAPQNALTSWFDVHDRRLPSIDQSLTRPPEKLSFFLKEACSNAPHATQSAYPYTVQCNNQPWRTSARKRRSPSTVPAQIRSGKRSPLMVQSGSQSMAARIPGPRSSRKRNPAEAGCAAKIPAHDQWPVMIPFTSHWLLPRVTVRLPLILPSMPQYFIRSTFWKSKRYDAFV